MKFPVSITSICSVFLSCLSLNAATLSFSVSSGDWSDIANWKVGSAAATAIPGPDDTAVVTSAREAVVSSVIGSAPGILRIGNNADGGTLRITAGALSATNFQAATAASSTGHLVLSGGSLTVGNSSLFSANGTVTGTSSTLTINGGNFTWGNTLNIGNTGTTLATVSGNTATITGVNIIAGAGTTFAFNVASGGVTPYVGTGTMEIASGATLVVDLAGYSGVGGSFGLFEGFTGGITGGFGGNVSFLNPGSFSPQLVLGADSISVAVVPEPRTYSLVIAFAVMVGIFWRRLRAR